MDSSTSNADFIVGYTLVVILRAWLLQKLLK